MLSNADVVQGFTFLTGDIRLSKRGINERKARADMKSVLISINPKWCELIASGKKTVEVRKTRPKLDTPFKCYIYCTNKRPFLVWGDVFRGNWETEFTRLSGYNRKEADKIWDVFNGKVIGEFVCNNITNLFAESRFWLPEQIEKLSCLSIKEILSYAKGSPKLYGWHISDLKIYDNPISIQTFRKWNECYRGIQKDDCEGCWDCEIKKPPQSWCYVETDNEQIL